MPPVIGRRKFVWLLRPWAVCPSGLTATQVAIEQIDSAIEAKTPPWTSPAGCRSSRPHGDLRADMLVVGFEHLEAVVGVEAGEGAEGLVHRGGSLVARQTPALAETALKERHYPSEAAAMTPLDLLAPDQRAVLELVLRQDRSYGELSELLGIPEQRVRERADAALHALAGAPDGDVDTGRITDWLLGQQTDRAAAATRTQLERTEPARAWAARAAERLREVGGERVPAVPEAASGAPAPTASAEPVAPRPRPLRDEAAPRPRPARAAAPAGAGSDGGGGSGPLAVAGSSTPRRRAADRRRGARRRRLPRLVRHPRRRRPRREDREQRAQRHSHPRLDAAGHGQRHPPAGGQRLQGRRPDAPVQVPERQRPVRDRRPGHPEQPQGEFYAVWFAKKDGTAKLLGFPQTSVTNNVLTVGGPGKKDAKDFPRLFATYDNVLITRETKASPATPGPIVLSGTLPHGQ